MQVNKEEVKKILIIRFKALGDLLLTQPAVRAVKESYPKAKVSVLVNREGLDIMSGLELADEVICFDKRAGQPLIRDLELIERVIEEHFDLVIDLFGNMRSALITLLSGAKYRVGLTWRFRKYFYNIRVEGPKEAMYGADVNLLVVKAVGAETKDKSMDVFVPEEATRYIAEFLEKKGLENKKVVGINPFASFMTRDWGIKKFAALSDLLKAGGFEPLIVWGPGQEERAKELVEMTKSRPVLAPETGVKELAALFKKLSAVVTPTTFTQHLAVALGTPCIAVAGATDQRAWAPADGPKYIGISAKLPCMPCEKTYCDKFVCMEAVSVKEVFDAVIKLIKK